jgi:predicted ATP-grasp superfamily ATP-dependent carboligase
VLDPDDLYELERDLPELGRPVLVHALSGFIDAGAAGRLVRDHLLEHLEHRVVATFDVDGLLDYRSRRPAMVFVRDHWESYDEPRLVLHAVTDNKGTPFLLLEGLEPDILWERFVAAVRALVERFGVRLTVGVHGIPMGVPHTRATGITAHATRPELVAGREPWIDTVQVPGSVINLLEYRFGQAGHDAMGFAVHVPQYLAQAEYPDAAAVLIDGVADVTGLSLPTAGLRAAAEETRAQVDTQVAESEEVTAVVRALEQQYDAYVGSRDRDNLLSGRTAFPTADELGAELERFLAEHGKDEGGREGRDG